MYQFYARHAGRTSEVALRHAKLVKDIPAFYALDAWNRVRFARKLFGHYEGLSRDRLEHLSERLYTDVIAPRLFEGIEDFLEGCRARGPLVLVSGAADFSVSHFARRFKFDGVIANKLEFKDGLATGRLIPPEVFGHEKARQMTAYARQHGLDLGASAAYADSISDLAMFDVVGRAGVINPNARLAQLAADARWQILHFEAPRRPRG
jgi:HAD superfamily hydrolase (TIGR01490 family)